MNNATEAATAYVRALQERPQAAQRLAELDATIAKAKDILASYEAKQTTVAEPVIDETPIVTELRALTQPEGADAVLS